LEIKPLDAAIRLGFRQITGFREDWAKAIVRARANAPFSNMENLARRARLPQKALKLLADSDAMGSLGLDRRAALWEARRTPDGELPLFAAAAARELREEPALRLNPLTLGEQVAADYQLTRLSLKSHPMAILRPVFDAEKILPCAALRTAKAGSRVRVAGVVLIRQRPGKGNAIFITLEDEDAIANVVLWASRFERFRRPVMAARLMVVEGEVQRSKEGVVHLMADRIIDRSDVLARLSDMDEPKPELSPADVFKHPQSRHDDRPRMSQHPRNVRLLPRPRDFH